MFIINVIQLRRKAGFFVALIIIIFYTRVKETAVVKDKRLVIQLFKRVREKKYNRLTIERIVLKSRSTEFSFNSSRITMDGWRGAIFYE